MKKNIVFLILIFFLLSPSAYGKILTTHTHIKTNDVVVGKKTVMKAVKADKASATKKLKLSLVLPLRNQAELSALIKGLYDPKSPNYRKYLSVKEFTDKYAPTEESYQKVIKHMTKNGMVVRKAHNNRMVLDVDSSIDNAEKTFNVKISNYNHPKEKRNFLAPDREPTLSDTSIDVWHVSGLDTLRTVKPLVKPPKYLQTKTEPLGCLSSYSSCTGSGPTGFFTGSDMRAAYYGSGTLTGKGQSVALISFTGYDMTEVVNYFATLGQPLNVPIIDVSIDGELTLCNASMGCSNLETSLDIESIISMAPQLDSVIVYTSNYDYDVVGMFNQFAVDNVAKIMSISWVWSPANPEEMAPIFAEMAAQGQTAFAASGDWGPFCESYDELMYPSYDVNVTSVGGTGLTMTGGVLVSENVWSAGGGGIDPNNTTIPSWQSSIGNVNGASTSYRNVPDVSASANWDHFVCGDGDCFGGVAGTSFAAPYWSGFTALVNQQLAIKGSPTVGFLNPTLYTIGLGANYSTGFNDITTGAIDYTTYGGTCPSISAATGYDLATGWGSPKSGLVDIIAGSIGTVNGVCGSSNGGVFTSDPLQQASLKGGMCSSGNIGTLTLNDTTYSWGCTGVNGGSSVTNCSATHTPDTYPSVVINTDSYTATGTASDATGVGGCVWNINRAPTSSIGTSCEGTTSFSCSTTGYQPNSVNKLYIECYDSVGNLSTGHYKYITYTPVAGDDVTPPELSSASIINGATLTLTFTEAVVNHTGFSVSPSNPLTYVSGEWTNTLIFTLTNEVHSGDVLTLSYSPGNVVDTADTPNSLGVITDEPITNYTTEPPPEGSTGALLGGGKLSGGSIH